MQVPDAGAGEGVPHQPLPHPAAQDRDGAPALPHRAADQDLVPEQVKQYNTTIFGNSFKTRPEENILVTDQP